MSERMRVVGDVVVLLCWLGPWVWSLGWAWFGERGKGGGSPKEIVIRL